MRGVENMNGINPVLAIVLTAIIAALTILLFAHHHPVWGVIFALITVDFCADAVLSLKRGG